MSLQPVHGALLDQQIDQRQPFRLVDGFSQQLPITIDIKIYILFVHPNYPAISAGKH